MVTKEVAKKQKNKRRVRRKSTAPKAATHPVKHQPVDPNTVTLVEGSGGPKRGGGTGGHYWHIQAGNQRAGHVFINIIEDEFFGPHASVQIHLNQSARGKQIGRVAYRLACEQSSHDKVYAHMRKSNVASRRAAEEAGFRVITDERIPQLSMVWQRQPATK